MASGRDGGWVGLMKEAHWLRRRHTLSFKENFQILFDVSIFLHGDGALPKGKREV
jgi:hypothetical protein